MVSTIKEALVLGGTGLIGEEIVKQLAGAGTHVRLVSLGSSSDKKVFSTLKSSYKNVDHITGNVFVPRKYKDKTFNELLESENFLDEYISIIFSETNHPLFLNDVIAEAKPEVVVDALNSATVLSYTKNLDLVSSFIKGDVMRQKAFLATLSMPRLIMFFRSLYKSLLETQSIRMYLKVGTTGTGGLGFNIPYTHGEDKPSRQLLEKAAISGAFTGLLYVLSQSFKSTSIKEIKPAALVGVKSIGFGPILLGRGNHGRLKAYEFKNIRKLDLNSLTHFKFSTAGARRDFESVFVDTGENGQFSLEEFRSISNQGQMGMVTKEEVAKVATDLLFEKSSDGDVVRAFTDSVIGPSGSGQVLRKKIAKQMRKLEEARKVKSLAFELLGPPRLSKLIFEAYLVKKYKKTSFETEEDFEPEDVVLIVSTGIPILLPKDKLIIGKVPGIPKWGTTVTKEDINSWAKNGWVDLRRENIKKWEKRFAKYSLIDKKFEIGDIVAWIFENEDKGYRFKK